MPDPKDSLEKDDGFESVCECCGKRERGWSTPDGWFFFRVIARCHKPPDPWHMPKTDFEFCSLDCANGWIARATEWPAEHAAPTERSDP